MSASLTLVVHSHHILYILFIVFTTFYIVVHTWWFPCNQPYCGPLSERALPHCTFYTSVSPNTAIPDSRLRSGPIWIRVKLWLSQIRLKIRIIFNGDSAAAQSFVSQRTHNCRLSGWMVRSNWCLYPASSFIFVSWQNSNTYEIQHTEFKYKFRILVLDHSQEYRPPIPIPEKWKLSFSFPFVFPKVQNAILDSRSQKLGMQLSISDWARWRILFCLSIVHCKIN